MARPTQECNYPSDSILPMAHDHPYACLAVGEGVLLCHWHRVLLLHTHLTPVATVSITGLSIDLAVLEDTYSWYAPAHFFHIVSPHRLFSFDSGHSSGEWAIARLQAEAAQHLRKQPHTASDVDVNDLFVAEEPFIGPDRDRRDTQNTTPQRIGAQKKAIRVGRYHCIYGNHHGNLCLDAEGVHFEVHLTASQKWKLKYAELKSMQKVRLSVTYMTLNDR